MCNLLDVVSKSKWRVELNLFLLKTNKRKLPFDYITQRGIYNYYGTYSAFEMRVAIDKVIQ
jgi:hypothetical protein